MKIDKSDIKIDHILSNELDIPSFPEEISVSDDDFETIYEIIKRFCLYKENYGIDEKFFEALVYIINNLSWDLWSYLDKKYLIDDLQLQPDGVRTILSIFDIYKCQSRWLKKDSYKNFSIFFKKHSKHYGEYYSGLPFIFFNFKNRFDDMKKYINCIFYNRSEFLSSIEYNTPLFDNVYGIKNILKNITLIHNYTSNYKTCKFDIDRYISDIIYKTISFKQKKDDKFLIMFLNNRKIKHIIDQLDLKNIFYKKSIAPNSINNLSNFLETGDYSDLDPLLFYKYITKDRENVKPEEYKSILRKLKNKPDISVIHSAINIIEKNLDKCDGYIADDVFIELKKIYKDRLEDLYITLYSLNLPVTDIVKLIIYHTNKNELESKNKFFDYILMFNENIPEISTSECFEYRIPLISIQQTEKDERVIQEIYNTRKNSLLNTNVWDFFFGNTGIKKLQRAF